MRTREPIYHPPNRTGTLAKCAEGLHQGPSACRCDANRYQRLLSDESPVVIADDGKEKYCSVQVDGEESFLIFMDSVSSHDCDWVLADYLYSRE